MSINAVNGFSNVQFGGVQADPIKPETRDKLKALGIDEKSVRTETQAQAKIQVREEEIKKQIQERIQAEASQQQTAQASSQIQPQQVQNVDNAQKVDGINPSQQVQAPKGIEQQHAINNNQQQGNEHVKAFAASHAPQQNQQIPQNEAFELDKDLVAMYNKLKLGLV